MRILTRLNWYCCLLWLQQRRPDPLLNSQNYTYSGRVSVVIVANARARACLSDEVLGRAFLRNSAGCFRGGFHPPTKHLRSKSACIIIIISYSPTTTTTITIEEGFLCFGLLAAKRSIIFLFVLLPDFYWKESKKIRNISCVSNVMLEFSKIAIIMQEMIAIWDGRRVIVTHY